MAELAWLADPLADSLPTTVVTHQLQVKRGTGKVRRPETDVLPLCHATNPNNTNATIMSRAGGRRQRAHLDHGTILADV